jgi:hypothetical protein
MTGEIGWSYRFRFDGDRAAAAARLAQVAEELRELPLDEVGALITVDQLAAAVGEVPRFYTPSAKYYRYWVARTQQDTIDDWTRALALILPVRVVDGCDRFEIALCSSDDRHWRGAGETVTEYAPDFDQTHDRIGQMLEICNRHGILESRQENRESRR